MRSTVAAAVVVCLMALINSAYSAAAEKKADAKTESEPAAGDVKAEASAGEDETEGDEEAGKTVNLAVIGIQGSLPESAPEPGLFGEMSRSLTETLRRLRLAAIDDDITAVVLKLRSPSIGRAKVAEIRASIDRLQKEGKKVYADISMATTTDYLLASTCDEIVMTETGLLLLPGVRAEVMFYKGLLDKLGVEADMMQVGDFKGAAEPMTRSSMSPEFRKQFTGVVDDFYSQLVHMIASDRNLPEDRVKQLIDRGLFSPQKAQEAGLIDTVAYPEDFRKQLKKEFQADELVMEKNYGRKQMDTDFSGMMGFIKLFELVSGVSTSERSSGKPKIAIIYGTGAIMSGESGSSLLGGSVMGSDTIVRALKKAAEDETVKAIVFRVNSPGGSAMASDAIWRQVRQVREKKPVIASMGDTAASGGYYVSMGCDKIYAEKGTLTGSIGVVGGKLAVGGLYDKIGLTTEVISRGKHSGILSMDTPFTDSEREVWKEYMQEVYDTFTSKAAESRKLDPKQLESLAGGRIWTGRQAAANGLVDEVGTLYDAIAAAKQAAGLDPDEKLEMLELPVPRSFFDQLFDTPIDESRMQLRDTVEQLAPGAAARIDDLHTLRRLFAEPALMMMPYRIDIR